MEDLDKWSAEKVMACLARIVHSEVLPSISAEDYKPLEYAKEFEGEQKVRDILKRLYQKSNKKLEIYGDVELMVDSFWKIMKIPEFITFSSNQKVEVSSECAFLTPLKGYKDFATNTAYTSKSNMAIIVFRMADYAMKSFGKGETFALLFSTWQTAILNKSLRKLKNSYDLIPVDSQVPLINKLVEFVKKKPTLTIPKETIGLKWFIRLKKHFDPEEQQFFTEAVGRLKPEQIAANQEEFKKAYAEIVYLIENVQKFFDEHAELFTPTSKLQTISLSKKPVIRTILGTHTDFCFSKEVETVLKRIVKKNPSKLKLLKDLVVVESEEERKNGVVYVIQPPKFEEILKKLGVTSDSYVLLNVMLENDYRIFPFPTISSYGTHCLPAFDAFNNIIYYLAVILKVFSRSNADELQEVFKWVDTIIDSFFVKKPHFYMLEMWKIEEIMAEARVQFNDFPNEPVHEVAFRSEYTNNQTIEELEKLTKNLGIEKHFFTALATQTINKMIRTQMGGLTIRNVYTGYSEIVRLYLQKRYEKIHSFILNQWINLETKEFDVLSVDNKPKSKPEEKPFTGWKKGFLNNNGAVAKKQEPKQQENMPSFSSENRAQQEKNGNLAQKQESGQREEIQKNVKTPESAENANNQIETDTDQNQNSSVSIKFENKWSAEKVLASMKHVVHPELFPPISFAEIERFGGDRMFETEQNVIDFLKLIYRKSNGILEIYGSVENMMESFNKIDQIPELIVFSPLREGEISTQCAVLTHCMAYSDATGKLVYSSKNNLLINTFQHLFGIVKSCYKSDIVINFLLSWITAFLNKMLRALKGSYDLISTDLMDSLVVDLNKFFKFRPNAKVPKGVVTFQWFNNLRIYFDKEGEDYLNDALMDLKAETITAEQEYYRIIYAEIVLVIENIKKIFEKYAEFFIPFSEFATPPVHQKPVVRLFLGTVFEYFLAREVKNAIELVIRNRLPDEKKLLNDLVIVESENERTNGIVHTLQPYKFEEILKKLGLSEVDFVILGVQIDEDYRFVSFPIISSYGTHCIPAMDAFDNIIYYLTVIQKVFQKSNAQNLQRIFDWIDTVMGSFFVDKSVFYLIEIWKIDQIIGRARKDLARYLTEPAYEVPFQVMYVEPAAHQALDKLTISLRNRMDLFELFALRKKTVDLMTNEPIRIKHIYTGYSQMVRLVLQKNNTKYQRFVDNQWGYRKLEQPPSNLKFFTEDKLIEDVKNGQEVKQDEKPQEPQKSPGKSAENTEIQQLRTELEKLKDYKNRLQDKLKTEKDRLKIVTESSEKEIQQLREELEKYQKKNTKLETDLETERSRLKNISDKSEKDIQKVREELDKSQKSKTQLEEDLKSERNRTENAEKDIQKFQEKVEKTREEKSQLLEYIKREKKRLKSIDEDTRNLREDLEKSQKAKIQLEDGLTTQLKAVKISLEEKLQKVQEELEKSQGANAQLKGNLKTLELSHLKEVQNLKKNHVQPLLLEKLEKENAELEDKLRNLGRELDDSKQKNEQLQADNFKNTKFQQKIKEHSKVLKEGHCDLVDIAWSRLCSKYPDVEEAKIDVRKMEDCLDEYVENVKKEYKKLRD